MKQGLKTVRPNYDEAGTEGDAAKREIKKPPGKAAEDNEDDE